MASAPPWCSAAGMVPEAGSSVQEVERVRQLHGTVRDVQRALEAWDNGQGSEVRRLELQYLTRLKDTASWLEASAGVRGLMEAPLLDKERLGGASNALVQGLCDGYHTTGDIVMRQLYSELGQGGTVEVEKTLLGMFRLSEGLLERLPKARAGLRHALLTVATPRPTQTAAPEEAGGTQAQQHATPAPGEGGGEVVGCGDYVYVAASTTAAPVTVTLVESGGAASAATLVCLQNGEPSTNGH